MESNNQNFINKMEHDETYRVKKVSNFVKDTDGNLIREGADGVISEDNSTSTPLTSGATFTGSSIDILTYGIVFINVYSDTASATDGLSIEQSSNGINWDHNDVYTVPAGGAKNYSINPYARYLRIRYTNGATNQTVFRLQTILKTNSKPSSHRIQDGISDEDDAELVKSVLTGENGNGSFKNVKVTTDGNLAISDNSSGLSIAQGNVTGVSFVHKFGHAPDFDTTDGVVSVWDGADDGNINAMSYTYSTTADIDTVSSSDAGDTQDIEIQGLDTNDALVTQTVALNGQNKVTLSTALKRVFRMKNVDSSDLAGYVYCYVDGTITGGVPNIVADVRAVIQNGNNQTLMALYTVPAGKTGYVRSFFGGVAGANKNSNYTLDLFARPSGQVFQLKHKTALSDNGSSQLQHDYVEPEVFLAGTDIEMRVSVLAGGATGAGFSAGFDIVLVDD